MTDIPSTTRDILEPKLDIGGYPVVMVETAGMRSTTDFIEKEGVKRAVSSAQNADITVVMCDTEILYKNPHKLNNFLHGEHFIYIAGKADSATQDKLMLQNKEFIPISVHKKINLQIVEKKIIKFLSAWDKEPYVITSTRHRKALEGAKHHLGKVNFNNDLEIEIAAEDLRIAANCIGSKTGIIHLMIF